MKKRGSLYDKAVATGAVKLADDSYVHVDPDVARDVLERGGRFAVSYVSTPIFVRKSSNRLRLALNAHVDVVFPLDRYVVGRPPFGQLNDHANGNRRDARRSNLRVVSQSQNSRNKAPRGASKYMGVSWNRKSTAWRAYIRVDGRDISLGAFDDEQDAARAYNRGAREYGVAEHARLNLVNDDGGPLLSRRAGRRKKPA